MRKAKFRFVIGYGIVILGTAILLLRSKKQAKKINLDEIEKNLGG